MDADVKLNGGRTESSTECDDGPHSNYPSRQRVIWNVNARRRGEKEVNGLMNSRGVGSWLVSPLSSVTILAGAGRDSRARNSAPVPLR